MTVVYYVQCDGCCNTWEGTVKSAIRYGWIRVGGPSGGGSVPTTHFCSTKCKKEADERRSH